MSDTFLHSVPATGIIKLKTLIRMRWLAIAGQAGALLGAVLLLKIDVPLGAALTIIATSLLVNIAAYLLTEQGPVLRNLGATLSLLFDTVQLALLLHVTGGLSNPFVVMLLVPMIVASSLLAGRSVIFLTAAGMFALSALYFFSEPLAWPDEGALPALFHSGEYLALAMTGLFLVIYVRKVARESRRLAEALAGNRLALEREQKLSAFGALAAAVAHELGSPLSTMAIIAKDMKSEVQDPALAADLELMTGQIERCRAILSDFARHNVVADRAFETLPLRQWLEHIAAPYQREGIRFNLTSIRQEGEEPRWPLQPSLMHGVANPLQNAFAFARTGVRLDVTWQGQGVRLTVEDDGPGFPHDLLGRLGEAYVSARAGEKKEGHMGLGLFIAKALLERSGATVTFANAVYSNGRVKGAEVTMEWKQEPV
jgi:two-component system sensor histidine kinase RegB